MIPRPARPAAKYELVSFTTSRWLSARSVCVEPSENWNGSARPVDRPFGRDGDRPRGAMEQAHSQVLLRLLNEPGYRRVGHIERVGRFRECAGFDHPDKGVHRSDAVHDAGSD